jgi:hypothetical protein
MPRTAISSYDSGSPTQVLEVTMEFLEAPPPQTSYGRGENGSERKEF